VIEETRLSHADRLLLEFHDPVSPPTPEHMRFAERNGFQVPDPGPKAKVWTSSRGPPFSLGPVTLRRVDTGQLPEQKLASLRMSSIATGSGRGCTRRQKICFGSIMDITLSPR